ncbi:hypothetical protein [Ornithinimicrobium kibberense]
MAPAVAQAGPEPIHRQPRRARHRSTSWPEIAGTNRLGVMDV